MDESDQTPRAWVGRLATALEVDVSAAAERFCDAFDGELRHFLELGALIEPASLALVTLGHGTGFADRLTAFLHEGGFDDGHAGALADLRETIDDWMLVRLLAGGRRDPELGLYFRRPLDVEATVAWVAERGVSRAEQEALRTLGRLVGSDRTGIFAASFRPGQPVVYKPYLHAFADDDRSLTACFRPVFEHFQVAGDGWPRLLACLDGMGVRRPSDIFVSLQLGDGDAFDSLKLDLFQVDVRAFALVLREAGLLSDASLSPASLGERLGLHTAEHCGLRFAGAACGLTFYFVPPREQ